MLSQSQLTLRRLWITKDGSIIWNKWNMKYADRKQMTNELHDRALHR